MLMTAVDHKEIMDSMATLETTVSNIFSCYLASFSYIRYFSNLKKD